MKRTIALSFAAFSLIALSLSPLLSGCKTKLEQGGAYSPAALTVDSSGHTNTVPTAAPEIDLFIADSAFNVAVDSVQIVLQTERDNRELLQAKAPQVKKALDEIRPKIVEAIKAYGSARKAYLASPTPAGLDGIGTALSKVQQLLSFAQAAIPPEVLNLTGPKARTD